MLRVLRKLKYLAARAQLKTKRAIWAAVLFPTLSKARSALRSNPKLALDLATSAATRNRFAPGVQRVLMLANSANGNITAATRAALTQARDGWDGSTLAIWQDYCEGEPGWLPVVDRPRPAKAELPPLRLADFNFATATDENATEAVHGGAPSVVIADRSSLTELLIAAAVHEWCDCRVEVVGAAREGVAADEKGRRNDAKIAELLARFA